MSYCSICGRGDVTEVVMVNRVRGRFAPKTVPPQTAAAADKSPTMSTMVEKSSKTSKKRPNVSEKTLEATVETIAPIPTNIPELIMESASETSSKRGRGRPLGCKDTVKRRPKGSLNKPPVKHGMLGRPKGVKDSKPRQRKVILIESRMPLD